MGILALCHIFSNPLGFVNNVVQVPSALRGFLKHRPDAAPDQFLAHDHDRKLSPRTLCARPFQLVTLIYRHLPASSRRQLSLFGNARHAATTYELERIPAARWP